MVDDALTAAASRFADNLARTVGAVVGHEVGFTATVIEGTDRVGVAQTEPGGVMLTVEGSPLLTLKVSSECGWDGPGQFLAVHQSEIQVLSASGSREPLFRYDFTKRPVSEDIPCAHVQVHGHRDALTFAMSRTGQRTRRARRRGEATATVPRMADLHFPLGGRRFRPALEDVLQMIVEEFGVDAEDGWREHLADARRTWRRLQLQAAVRDDAQAAAETLQSMGYDIGPPASGHPEPMTRRLGKP